MLAIPPAPAASRIEDFAAFAYRVRAIFIPRSSIKYSDFQKISQPCWIATCRLASMYSGEVARQLVSAGSSVCRRRNSDSAKVDKLFEASSSSSNSRWDSINQTLSDLPCNPALISDCPSVSWQCLQSIPAQAVWFNEPCGMLLMQWSCDVQYLWDLCLRLERYSPSAAVGLRGLVG